ncbi:MAG TPA: hypothetical protein VKA13_04010 [Gammaproteobacteria bacterium]|nr:hypothetical protein [Gammaproteobacteria bacterium]
MKKTLLGLFVLFSSGALAAPPMDSGDKERSLHMLKGMPMGPVGRYQIVRLIEGDQNHAAVMILDTANGHLWEWRERPTGKGSEAKAAVIYMGHVEPAAKPGQVIESYTVPSR